MTDNPGFSFRFTGFVQAPEEKAVDPLLVSPGKTYYFNFELAAEPTGLFPPKTADIIVAVDTLAGIYECSVFHRGGSTFFPAFDSDGIPKAGVYAFSLQRDQQTEPEARELAAKIQSEIAEAVAPGLVQ